MYGHPRFLRQIIPLDLAGEVRMHNGGKITQRCTEEKAQRRMQGPSGFLPRRGLRGWPACLLFWQKGPWDLGGGG